MWKDNKKRLRRFLRDPNANIWTDGFLIRVFNDAQVDLGQVFFLETVEAIRVPPQYEFTYLNDWEFNFLSTTGKFYQALKYQQQSGIVCCFKWEQQEIGIGSGADSDEGHAFTHPWEVYTVTNANALSPVYFPENFKQTRFIAWDNEPIDYCPKKTITSMDASWKTQSGVPYAYFREDELSNEFYLYPRPDTPEWDDIDGSAHPGMVLYNDQNLNIVYMLEEDGTIMLEEDGTPMIEESDLPHDYPGAITEMDEMLVIYENGIATDSVKTDNNVLLIYDAQPTDMGEEDDESDFPKFMQKYVEYGALEKAYSANTDGRIGSLRDYWAWRKELGEELIKKFKWSRLADRDFRLVSQQGSSRRNRRGPRLPDTYPDVR